MKQFEQNPYVSINGPVDPYDITKVATSGPARSLKELGRNTIFGIQVSEKTQKQNIENKYGPNWYPVGKRLQNPCGAWRADELLIHLNTNNTHPTDIGIFAMQIYTNGNVIETSDSDLDFNSRLSIVNRISGYQLNRLPWHLQDYQPVLEKMRPAMHLSRLILQASISHLEQLNPNEFVAKLRPYAGYISSVLIDASSGQGIPLNSQKIKPYIEACYEKVPEIAVTVAGGINHQSVDNLAGTLLADYPTLSLDAESGLRDNYQPDNPRLSSFSANKAIKLLEKVGQILPRN